MIFWHVLFIILMTNPARDNSTGKFQRITFLKLGSHQEVTDHEKDNGNNNRGSGSYSLNGNVQLC